MVPEAAGVHFCDRHVEMGSQPVFQAANHLPLVLERLSGFNMEFEAEESDHLVLILSRITDCLLRSDIHFRLLFLYKTLREFGVTFSNPQSEVIALRRSLP